MQTHLPALAGALDPDFIEKTIKGAAGTELEANTLAGTSGRPRSRPYRKTNKGDERVPRSRQTHFPVLVGFVATDFIEKTNKGGAGTEL